MPRGRPRKDSLINQTVSDDSLYMEEMGTVDEVEEIETIDNTMDSPIIDAVNKLPRELVSEAEFDNDFGIDVNLSEMVEIIDKEINEYVATPCRTDENWTEHALSFFQETELDTFGNPKVASLVRVAEKINGPIVSMITEIVDSPNKDNEFRCVATVKLSFDTPIGTKTFSGTADAYPGNIKGPNTEDNVFKKFAVALSETRALGRAARHSLNLRNVVASEEFIEPTAEDWQPISSTQINSLDCLCKRMNIDIMKFVNLSKNKVNNINKVARSVAATMFTTLSSYERGECKPELKNRIDQCKGYQNDWRS